MLPRGPLTTSDEWERAAVRTPADGSVVTPGSQCVRHPLTGDTFGTLKYVAVVAAELDTGADSVGRDTAAFTPGDRVIRAETMCEQDRNGS